MKRVISTDPDTGKQTTTIRNKDGETIAIITEKMVHFAVNSITREEFNLVSSASNSA